MYAFPVQTSRAQHPPWLDVPCRVYPSRRPNRWNGAAVVVLFFLQPLREPVSLYDSPFVCAVAEREAVCSHHSCRTDLLLQSSGLVVGSTRQTCKSRGHANVVSSLNSASRVRAGSGRKKIKCGEFPPCQRESEWLFFKPLKKTCVAKVISRGQRLNKKKALCSALTVLHTGLSVKQQQVNLNYTLVNGLTHFFKAQR